MSKKKWNLRNFVNKLFEEKDISIDDAINNRSVPKKNKRKSFSDILLISLFVLSIILLASTTIYTGYVAYHEGIGGTIYQMELLYKKPAFNWAGLYGAAFGVGQEQPWMFDIEQGSTNEANMFFDCVEPDKVNLLFASYVPEAEVSINSLTPASPEEIDALIGIDASYYDSATKTFTETMSITLGERTISNIPAVKTNVGTDTPEGMFNTGILKDENDNYVYVAELNEALSRGFNNRFYNYQFLLPIIDNSTTTYHVFIDPFNVCVGGDDEPEEQGIVYGSVTDLSGNPLEDVLITVAGYSTVTDGQGFYNLTTRAGPSKIIAILEGYSTYESDINVTLNEETEHNIMLEIDAPPVDFVDMHPDIGPDFGEDVGPGEVPFQIERPAEIEGQEFWIPFNRITKRIREGEFAQETVVIQSFRDGTMQVNFDLVGDFKNITNIDRDSISIGARGDGRVTLTFFGNQTPGIYNGTINITGDIDANIPVEIEILDKDKIPIQALLIGISMSDRTIYSGSRFTFRTDLTNMLSDREYPVNVLFSIQDISGEETIWTQSANVFLKTTVSLLRNVELPNNLPPGEYVIRVTANYLDLSSSSSHVFTVSLPFHQYTLFWGVRVWHAILGSLLLFGIIIGIIVFKKRMEAKKKYHLKVEYSELPKPGPRSAFVGKIAETEKKSYMNLENFKTHTIVAGSTGGGKSFSAQVIIEEMLMKDVAVIVFDPTAQWTGMLRKLTNKGLMGLYPSFGMKPKDARPFVGNIRQIDNARELIDIRKYMKPGEIQVFAVHKLDPKDIDIFVANTVREVFHANFDESEPLRLCLVYDEVHRLLPKFGGSGEGFLQIERACREFRKWGIGVMLISQVLADFVGQIKANINTEIQMRTRDEGDLDRIKTKYGADVLQSLVKASIGTGMVQNSAYNRGRPYFTTFRPILHSVARLSDDEISQYNEYNKKIDQMTYEMEQLEEEGQDVFDLKLELKLALDKVKAGNFNMVKIYIEGLEPRLKKLWDKIGKEPKILKPKMVSKEELEKDLKKAQSERDKFDKENKKEESGGDSKEESPSEKFKKDVPPDKILKLNNDMLVVTPSSLYSEIEAMKDSDFEFHVNDKKNDFADWFKNAVGDIELGEHLANTKDRKEILDLLDKRGKGEKLPPLEKKESEDKKEETDENEPENTEKEKETQESAETKNKKDDNDDKQEKETDENEPENTEKETQENKQEATDENKQESTEKETQGNAEAENKEQENEKNESNEKEDPVKKESSDSEDIIKKESAASSDESVEKKNQEEDEEEQFDDETSSKVSSAFEKIAPDDKTFLLENGLKLHSIKDLYNLLDKISDDIFYKHVTSEKNDFANWVEHVFDEKELAEKIRHAKDRAAIKEVLRNG